MVMVFVTSKVYSEDIYSGYCIYPEALYKINFSSYFSPAENFTVSVKTKHTLAEIHRDNSGRSLENPAIVGRYLMQNFNYLKLSGVSGPYIELSFSIYSKDNKLTATIDPGKICNLSWWRDKYGKYEKSEYSSEDEFLTLPTSVLMPAEPKFREMAFCLTCFVLGAVMSFKIPKMLECLGEKGT